MLEDRLRAAFTALADTADSPPPGLRQPAGRTPAIAAAAAVLILSGGAWFAFQPEPAQVIPAPALTTVPATTAAQPPLTMIEFQLYTHCGIDEALIGTVFYEAETPIPQAPQDWGNPYQAGVMTLVSPSEAVFHDNIGHVVKFRARPGATAFKRICQ